MTCMVNNYRGTFAGNFILINLHVLAFENYTSYGVGTISKLAKVNTIPSYMCIATLCLSLRP